MQRVGDLVTYDCEFVKLSSGDGSEYERSPLLRVVAQVDEESIFGFHLVLWCPPPEDRTCCGIARGGLRR